MPNHIKETREEYETRMKIFFRKEFFPVPAYQFFMKYLETMSYFNPEDIPNHLPGYTEKGINYIKEFQERVSKSASQDINKELRLVEIEKELIPLIEKTDNKIFYRPLFFPTVFINNNFVFEDFIIKGLLIEDVPLQQDTMIYLLAMDKRTFEIMASIIVLTEKKVRTESYGEPEEETQEKSKRFNEHIQLLVCNIIDMVEGNDEDLEITTIHTTSDQNLKRIKRGKVPFPTKVYIRANKEFKRYIKDFNESDEECKENKLSCKFLVRGHWRHFRAERYTIKKRGEKTWIKPFYKGQGIVIAKEYQLRK
jgi:hypothetical protein